MSLLLGAIAIHEKNSPSPLGRQQADQEYLVAYQKHGQQLGKRDAHRFCAAENSRNKAFESESVVLGDREKVSLLDSSLLSERPPR